MADFTRQHFSLSHLDLKWVSVHSMIFTLSELELDSSVAFLQSAISVRLSTCVPCS